jgi:hypothetical protein
MVVAYDAKTGRRSEHGARDSRIARKLAALAGSAGAAVAGEAVAAGISYVPTSGVVAAQGIPGFSFAAPSTVTSGTLRPPSIPGNTGWDIDGNGQADFNLLHQNVSDKGEAFLIPQEPFIANPNGLLVTNDDSSNLIRNLANAFLVGAGATLWDDNGQAITSNAAVNHQIGFSTSQPNYFGFRFAFGSNANEYYYGWASLAIDFLAEGQGYKITEAFYQSTPNTGINVGAVPVPEPSSMALLAAGAAGVTAWRARRKKPPAAE